MSVGASVFATSVYVPSLLEERPVFVRERQAATYRVSSYTVYKLLNEASAAGLGVLLSTPVVYWACGLRRDAGGAAFFFFMLAMWVINLASSCITMFIAASSKSVEVGSSVVPLWHACNFFAAGFLIPPASLPVWWRWFYSVSFAQWGFSALMANQFQGQLYKQCAPLDGGDGFSLQLMLEAVGGTLVTAESIEQGYCRSENGEVALGRTAGPRVPAPCAAGLASSFASACDAPAEICSEYCFPIAGSEALRLFGLQDSDRWYSLAVLSLFVPFFGFLFFLSLKYLKYNGR